MLLEPTTRGQPSHSCTTFSKLLICTRQQLFVRQNLVFKKALNAKLHNIHKERWQPSIKKVFVATEITLSAAGNPSGVPADLRAATEIRMLKSHAHHSANDTRGKKKQNPPSFRRGWSKESHFFCR